MNAPIVATIGLTLQQVKALEVAAGRIPTDLLPGWAFEAINRLSIDSQDAVFDAPATDKPTTCWKMATLGGLEDDSTDVDEEGRRYISILQNDIARFLLGKNEEAAA